MTPMNRFILPLLFAAIAGAVPHRALAAEMEWVRIAKDQRGFVLERSGRPFIVWGFNYDHDDSGRLIEDYWESEWPKVDKAFRDMKQFGANVVRVHLQLAK